MIKKVILILTLPTLVFIYLESCNKECTHIETLTISGIDTKIELDTSKDRNEIAFFLNFESYFVSNFQFSLTNKALALTQRRENCFNKLLNPIDSISIISTNNFSVSFPANSELNSQFHVNNIPNRKVANFKYDVYSSDYDENIGGIFYETKYKFQNDSLPTLDSIHDLCITVYCENGDVFKDSLIGINLKSKF